jgi:hypothetical protein
VSGAVIALAAYCTDPELLTRRRCSGSTAFTGAVAGARYLILPGLAGLMQASRAVAE